MTEPIFKILKTLGTIGAATVPLLVISGFFGYSESIQAFMPLVVLIEILKIVSIPGLLFVLVMLWRSDETNNEKQYTTILAVIFFGIPLSIYWFSKGINSKWEKEVKIEPADGGNG